MFFLPIPSFSSFSPRSIPGLALWFDASDASTITQANGSISQWNDKSGNNNNLTQGSIVNQPTLQAAAQNSMNSVRFTAANSQLMRLTSVFNAPTGTTICAVARRAGPTGDNYIEILGLSTNTNALGGEWWNDTLLYPASATQWRGSIYTDASTGRDYNQVSWINNATSLAGLAAYFNGADITDTLASGDFSSAFNIGTTFDQIGFGDFTYCNGEIAEICIYNGLLSNSDRQKVEEYLQAKWQTQHPILPRPIAYYKLNSSSGTTAGDYSVNLYNGTLINGPLWVTGKFGSGLQFNGSNNYVSVTNPALQITGDVTYACWVNATDLSKDSDLITIGDFGYTIWYSASGGGIAFGVQTHDFTPFAPFTATNSWHHIVGTYTAGMFSLYIDGILAASLAGTNSTISFPGPTPLTIGAGTSTNSDGYFNGILDEVRIYNVALTAAQVNTIYNVITE